MGLMGKAVPQEQGDGDPVQGGVFRWVLPLWVSFSKADRIANSSRLFPLGHAGIWW